jgi:hypothetical protein
VRLTVAAGITWKSVGRVLMGVAVRTGNMLHSVQLLS